MHIPRQFFLHWFCFKLVLLRAATSWVSCLLEKVCSVLVAGYEPLADLLLSPTQAATKIQLKGRGFLRESALISDEQDGGGGTGAVISTLGLWP